MNEESKKDYGVLIAKKSEKLVTALYLVTDLMVDSEPIKHGLRKNAVALLSSMNALSQLDVKDRVIELKMSLKSVTEIISMLHVAVTTGIVSKMNGELLMEGFRSLQLVLEKKQPIFTKEMLRVEHEDESSEPLSLEKLGFWGKAFNDIMDASKQPHGMILVTGPTGSGKSTTLYTLINELNHPERKIITLEDPVEYQIEGITQIPIDTRNGASFAEGLRAVLRLDPDVVMVGEIRDTDTAKTALQASLTGHLVLSTYHASSAAAAMTRMLDAMGENPLFISAIRLIQAQRLCRRLDDQTKIQYRPDEALKAQLARVFAEMPAGIKTPNVNDIILYKPGSTPERPFGYDGQIALRELMLLDEGLVALLKKPKNEITATEIERKAVEDGRMLTMLQDGILKALEGKTSIEEVYRVVG
jgi:type II secretory ATPase GspE/PulE/Tfp pilus assembly ATPase PilB-like protein